MLNILKKNLIFFLLILIVFGCKSREEIIQDLLDEKNKYDRFEDKYEDFTYKNKILGLKVDFLSDWFIIPYYENFDGLQKKYARYIASEYGEVIFVGYNEEKKIGIRCVAEKLGLDNKKYLENLKTLSTKQITDYKIKFISEEEVVLKNIKALRTVFETVLNNNNKFIFDSIIFKYQDFNFKLDLWIKKSLYEENEYAIQNVYDSVDFSFEDEEKTKSTDNTSD